MQYEYKSLSQSYPEQGDRLPAAGGPPPMRIPGAARRTPRHSPNYEFRVIILFFSVFPFVLYDIRLPEDP